MPLQPSKTVVLDPAFGTSRRSRHPFGALATTTLLTATLLAANATGAQDSAGTPGPNPPDAAPVPLAEQLRALEQKVLILERKAEIAGEAETEKAKSGASVTASAKDGFSLKSNDGAYTFRLRGYVHVDARVFRNDRQDRSVDTLLLRRVRPIFEGTLAKRFAFRIMPDFGGGTTTLQDAWLDWKPSDAVQLRVGKFKAPFGLERLQSATDLSFVERALPTGLAPNRDLGLQLAGSLVGGKLDYAVGLFNGVPDGGSADSDTNDGKDIVARVFFSPWKGTPSALAGLSFGLAASQGDQQGSLTSPGLAGYRTAGQQTFFSWRADTTAAGTVIADGSRTRLSPQATWYVGPFGLLLEAVQSEHEVRRGTTVDTLTHEAWQVSGTWVLTGENASFRWYQPQRAFDRGASDPAKRGWGGVAIVARWNAFTADADSFPTFAASSAVEEATAWALGVDWTLQRQIRLLVDYEVTTFDGLGAVRPDEKVLFTRFQIGW